jgi:hypothetical protein
VKKEAHGRDSKHGNPSGARICIGFESLTEHPDLVAFSWVSTVN